MRCLEDRGSVIIMGRKGDQTQGGGAGPKNATRNWWNEGERFLFGLIVLEWIEIEVDDGESEGREERTK